MQKAIRGRGVIAPNNDKEQIKYANNAKKIDGLQNPSQLVQNQYLTLNEKGHQFCAMSSEEQINFEIENLISEYNILQSRMNQIKKRLNELGFSM